MSAALSSRLETARKACGYSFGALAERTGLSKPHVWELCTGKATNPTIETVGLLASALHECPAYLVGWDRKIGRRL